MLIGINHDWCIIGLAQWKITMDEFEKFYNKALKFLSYRPRSEKEIRDKLIGKKAPLEIIEKIIVKLKEHNFINDEEFAKWWIEQRTNFKKISLRFIRMELRQRGINDEIIESKFSDLKHEIVSDLDRAKQLVKVKIEKLKGLSRQEVYKKLGGFLARRGFDWDTIKQSIDESLKKRV